MKKNSNEKSGITIDIPVQEPRIFSSEAVNDVLLILLRGYPSQEGPSISELADSLEYTRPTISKTIETLEANDLVTTSRDGNAKRVQINGNRLHKPDDPILEIPQAEFHEPVREAVQRLKTELQEVLGIVLYGSVARGEADRRSDIDLWVLVEEDRMQAQREVNEIKKDLEATKFEQGRYDFHIDVEALQAVPTYTDEIAEIITTGLPLYSTDEYRTVRNMVVHGKES
jgi:predicted nucleotidyltransferase